MSTHAKKNNKIWKLILILFLILIIIIGIIIGKFITDKLSNINVKQLNMDDLGVNTDVYNKVSDTLTKSEFNKVKNIVLFGLDNQSIGDGQEEEGFVGRSDTIMIVSINPKYKSLKLISIPRDTYAEIEGHGKMKINHAYLYGREQLALKTINSNFELNLTEFITVNFEGLVHVINDIGGVELNITKAERDFINASSKLAYEVSGNEYKTLSSYGTVVLDGEQALTHSRNRKIGDDFTRAGRQRDVIESIISKFSKMSASQISSMFDILLKDVTTNIDFSDYIGTCTELLANKDSYINNIISAQVPSKDYATGQYIDGLYYFVPSDTERMKEDMINYLYKQ